LDNINIKTSPRILNSDWKQEAGPLRDLIDDASVSEIMVNGWDQIFVERNGIITRIEQKFKSADALNQFVQSLSTSVGRELNRKNPYFDARLPDGSRLNAVIPPIAFDGPVLTIRKASNRDMGYAALLQLGAVDEKTVFFLKQAVRAKQNLLISGGTGSGKTTILSMLTQFIGKAERVLSIEDTVELNIAAKNLVRLETRPALPNETAITLSQLLRNAMRMRPDRIVIGECRGAEAIDMLMAMNTGHEGSMTTVHANTAKDALRRLEAMILRSGSEAPLSMIQDDIANTINLVIQTERGVDGKRRIVEVIELHGRDQTQYQYESIIKYDSRSGYLSTGYIPKFVAENHEVLAKFPAGFFDPDYTVTLSDAG
jgi:pilus assembly protein CpaF